MQIKPAQYLKSKEAPAINPASRQFPISLAPAWTETMGFETRKELAERWGCGLLFGRLTQESIKRSFDNPYSVEYKALELAKIDPDRYPLDVYLNTQNYFAGERHAVSREKTPEAYLRDKDGNFILQKNYPIASPECPSDVWIEVVDDLTWPLTQLTAEGVQFNVIQHWAEWFFPLWGHGSKYYLADPKVVAAKESMVGEGNDITLDTKAAPNYGKWHKYLHTRRAGYEASLASHVKDAAPNRNAYNYYGLSAATHGKYGHAADWTDFEYTDPQAQTIADYPGSELYNPGLGQCMNDQTKSSMINGLLDAALASKAVEIEAGKPLNQNWIWLSQERFKEFPQYIGFVKCLFVLGMRGAIQYLQPDDLLPMSYEKPFEESDPPTWLLLVEAVARVNAQFTYFEDFQHEGKLIRGPYNHIYWMQHEAAKTGIEGFPNPGYVMENPCELFKQSGKYNIDLKTDANGCVRIVGRQKPDGEVLICAWSADGIDRTVQTTLPNGERVEVKAKASGTLYKGQWGQA